MISTPKINAVPIPTGNATAIPASAMAEERRILAALKIIPPNRALKICWDSACFRSAIKGLPSSPWLPNVKAKISESRKIPSM
ncbi:hypothetical protein D3C81_1637290 [compost metagenome]